VAQKTATNTGYRTFEDARGRAWEVWMVHPSSIERRKMERRTPVENAVNLIEQRVLGDRRSSTGARSAVASEYSSGWLCFSSDGEKRRLAPVPVNWMTANDTQVAEWLRVARRVMRCGPTWDPGDEVVRHGAPVHIEPDSRGKRTPAPASPPRKPEEQRTKKG
jgi:hypothetical protein